jgi:hypothetical protein
MTTIKELIEKGAYPKDEKGRALVPVGCEKVATICATDAPGEKPILGFIRSDDKLYQACWLAWDEHGNNCPRQPRSCWVNLLPPQPRKVKVTRYMLMRPNGNEYGFYLTKQAADRTVGSIGATMRVIELTGEYEEPWS